VRVLLDTSVLIGDRPPPEEVEAAISVVSITELHFGVLVVDDDDAGSEVRRGWPGSEVRRGWPGSEVRRGWPGSELRSPP